jgi:sec-independent protein translocase protein TatA
LGLRGQELLLILLIIVLIFGARKLPDLARSLGSSAKEFRKGIEDGNQDDSEEAEAIEAVDADPAKPDSPEVSES